VQPVVLRTVLSSISLTGLFGGSLVANDIIGMVIALYIFHILFAT
jgi:hypothetical protein